MDVKEMSGTEGFLDFPVNISKCQNEESVLECRSKKLRDVLQEREVASFNKF